MIKLSHVSKIYKNGKNECLALADVSLEIDSGDFVAITGPSGSGKSTLLNILGLMDCPTRGEYFLGEKNTAVLSGAEKARLRNGTIGFVLQNFGLIDEWSVMKNITVPLLYSKMSRRERTAAAEDVLRKLGIEEKRNEPAKNLSGGQKQRAAIARAIINNPSILLADEPTGALDRETSEEVMRIFTQLNDEGITVIVVTHDPLVARKCKKELSLDSGRI